MNHWILFDKTTDEIAKVAQNPTLMQQFLAKAWLPALEILVGFILGPLVKRMIMRLSSKLVDKGATTFIASCANFLIIFLAVVVAMEQLGVQMHSIVAFVTAAGLGISLALKSNMANVASGLQILFTKPFTVGDFIETPNHKGRVKSIEMMYSTLITNNNKEVVVPNSLLTSETLVNHSKYEYENIRIKLPVNYPIDLKRIQEDVMKITSANPMVLPAPEPVVTIAQFNEQYANVLIIVSVKWQNYEVCKHELKNAFVETINAYQSPQSS